MTTFSYEITLDDSEMIALEAALRAYEQICEAELQAGVKPPFWAHLRGIERIREKFFQRRTMMSNDRSYDEPGGSSHRIGALPVWDIERIAQRVWEHFFDGGEDERNLDEQLQAAREAAEQAVDGVCWGQPWREDRKPTDEEFEDDLVAIASEILRGRSGLR